MKFKLLHVPNHLQLGVRGWVSVAIALALFAAVTILISVLALGILVVALPAALLTAAYIHYQRSKTPRDISLTPATPSAQRTVDRLNVIEGTYSEQDRREL